MFEHEDSDSSDDVCFGEYTIKEAKRDLKKYVPRKVNRRHTYICKLGESQISSTKENPVSANHSKEDKMADSVTKCSLDYLTANESMSTDRSSQNSEFLEKLNKVINEPFSEASSYNTAFDRTNILENTNSQCDDTFLERFQNQTRFALDNIQHTLVENTVIPTEDSLFKAGYNEEHKDESSFSEEVETSIISVSDDSLSQLNSQYEFVTNNDAGVSKSPIIFNGENNDELFSKTISDEEFGSDSEISVKSQIEHTDSLYEASTNQQSERHECYSLCDENKVRKSSFGFKRLNVSEWDSEPKNYSCNIQLDDSLEHLSDGQESPKNSSSDLASAQLESLQRFERIIVNCNQLSKISEKTEFTSCIEDLGSMKLDGEKRLTSSPKSPCNSKGNKNSEIIEYLHEPQNSSTRVVSDTNFSSNSEIDNSSNIGGVPQFTSSEDNDQVSRCSETSAKSPIQVPESHVKQFDDSCRFDDTLEEMNRLLEQGVDYEMPEIKHSKITPVKVQFSSNDIISGSFMNKSLNSAAPLENKTPDTKSVEKCKVFYSAEKLKPSKVFKRTATTAIPRPKHQQEPTCKPSVFTRSPFAKHTEKLGGEIGFKVPAKPIKKLTTPSKIPNPALKNVVSPVGVYIKHSPKYHPMIKVHPNVGTPHLRMAKLVMPDSTSVKENIPYTSDGKIPRVIYKPSKNREIKVEKEIVLPGSITKLIDEQVVTKHEHRIQDDEGNQSIDRRLMEPNLSLDLSHNQDISILTNKQPFSIRKF